MISNTQEETDTKSPKNITKNKNVTSTINKTSEITSKQNSDVIQNNTKTTQRWSDMLSEEDEIPKEREQLITLKKWSETPTNENLLETQKETEKVRPTKHPKQPDQSTKKTSAVYNQTNFTKPKLSYNTHKKFPNSNSNQERSASSSEPNEQQSIPPEKKQEIKTAIIYIKNFVQEKLIETQIEEFLEAEQEEEEEEEEEE